MSNVTKSLLALILGFPASSGVLAQETTDNSVIEEIVVTAQKRAQSAQDVGIAVNVLSGEDIRELRVTTPQDIAAFAPNVDIKNTNSFGNPNIAIRGVGLNDFASNNSPTAGVYIDEVFMTSTAMMSFQLFDLERVEVLKGPQGTLYGRNTTAGAINFVTRKPSQEFDSYVSAGVGNYDLFEIEGAIGGALSETVSGRLSAKTIQQGGGYWDSTIFGEHGEVDMFTVRGQLLFDLSDSVDLLISAHADKDESDAPLWEGNGAFNAGLFDPAFTGTCAPVAANRVKPNTNCFDVFGYSDADDDPFDGDWAIPAVIDREGQGFRATLTADLSDTLTLTSVTGYEKLERKANDGDTVVNPAVVQFNTLVDTEIDQFSQELRLAGSAESVDWVAGFFYSTDSVEDSVTVNSPDLFGALLGVHPLVTDIEQDTDVWAVFGHTEWHLGNTVDLILGLRYTAEERDFQGDTMATVFGTTDVLSLSPQDDSVDFNKLQWKVGIEWEPVDAWMLYATAGTSFKSGGFFGGTALSPEERLAYDEEELTAYEVGFKSRLLDNTLQLNGAYFYYDYKDIQQLIEVGSPPIARLDNIEDDSKVSGVDLDLWWRAAPGLDIKLAVGLLKTELGDFSDGLGVLQSGNDLANSPEFTSSGLVRYEWSVSDSLVMSALASFSYSDEMFKNATNDEIFAAEDFTVVDARLTLSAASGAWEVALWGKNITDEEYVQESFGDLSLGTITRSYNSPPTYGLSFSYFMQ